MNRDTTIDRWFRALNDGDLAAVEALFDPSDQRIRNAAEPEVRGPGAVAAVVGDLFARTERRHFECHGVAHGALRSHASWTGILAFADGALVAGTTVRRFTAVVSGIDVFELTPEGTLAGVDIVHETTSVRRAAAANPAGWTSIDDASARSLVEQYLAAEEDEDLGALLSLVADDAVVRNAANPPDAAPGAVERFARSFWDRTERRRFELLDVGRDGDDVYAFVMSEIAFRAGATFGPITAGGPFTVVLPTALRFHVIDGLVRELDVHHETATAARLASRQVPV